jgi:uncharacterized membrane-anchored protein
MRLPKAYVPLVYMLAVVTAFAVGATVLESMRIAQAIEVRTEQVNRLLAAQRLLAQAKLETRDVNALIALDATISDVRASGLRRAVFLVKLGAQMPQGAWLESIVPNGKREAITGRATSLSVVARAIGRLDRAAFHHVTLDALSRVILPGRPSQIQFAIGVDGDE